MVVSCPVCRSACAWENNLFRPFCSERCQLVDLGNWADDKYRIAGDPVAGDDEEDDGRTEPTRH